MVVCDDGRSILPSTGRTSGAARSSTSATSGRPSCAGQGVGRIFGAVSDGKAFGDWSLQADDGRGFTEHDIVLYHAPRSRAGKDRSDPAILLGVYEWIRDR